VSAGKFTRFRAAKGTGDPAKEAPAYVVRSGRPCPESRGRQGGPAFPLAEMKPGDSFDLPRSDRKLLAAAISNVHRKKDGRKFVIRSLDAELCGCWREDRVMVKQSKTGELRTEVEQLRAKIYETCQPERELEGRLHELERSLVVTRKDFRNYKWALQSASAALAEAEAEEEQQRRGSTGFDPSSRQLDALHGKGQVDGHREEGRAC
jgi:hypothetical protein